MEGIKELFDDSEIIVERIVLASKLEELINKIKNMKDSHYLSYLSHKTHIDCLVTLFLNLKKY